MYLTKIDNYYSSKNQLEEAILNLLRVYDRLLVKPSQIKQLKSEIESRIALLNLQYKRCKPFSCHWHISKRANNKLDVLSDSADQSLILSPSSIAVFKIYAASKGEYFPMSTTVATNQTKLL